MTLDNQFCSARRKDGQPCGRRVNPPGARTRAVCWQHRAAKTRTPQPVAPEPTP